MPALFANSDKLAQLRDHAARGDQSAQALMALLDNTYYVALSAGVEAAQTANTIRVTGQVTDQDGSDVAGVKDVVVKTIPIAGAGTMTDGGAGTLKFGSATKEVWLQTDSAGKFEVDVLDATAEDCLVIAQLDNGTTEMLKLTFA